MKKGIVLEVHDDHVTMLTPEGEFLKSKKLKGSVSLGEEIAFFPFHGTERVKKRKVMSFFRIRGAVISVLTAAILIFSIYPQYANNQVHAYVSLDVNPSLELGINKSMQVVSIDAYNEEGEMILEGLHDWKKKELSLVSKQLFDMFRRNGYLKTDTKVVIASVIPKDEELEWKKKMEEEITYISKAVQMETKSVTTLEVTNEKRGEAIKKGVSPGKYVQDEQNTEMLENEEDDTSKSDVEEPNELLTTNLKNVKDSSDKVESKAENKKVKDQEKHKSIKEDLEKANKEKRQNNQKHSEKKGKEQKEQKEQKSFVKENTKEKVDQVNKKINNKKNDQQKKKKEQNEKQKEKNNKQKERKKV